MVGQIYWRRDQWGRLHLFTAHAQSEAGPGVGAHVQLVLLLELVCEIVEEDVIQIAPAQVPIPSVRKDSELAFLEGHNGHLVHIILSLSMSAVSVESRQDAATLAGESVHVLQVESTNV